jgi:putative lipoprotein
MKIKVLIFTLFLGIFNLSAYGNYDVFHKEKNNTTKEKVDCSDPKNRPRDIGGILRGGKKECYRNLNAETAKRDLDLTIGRNPVTGEVTSRAKLAGGDNATMRLENAQMNYGKKKYELEEAEKFYADDPSVKNSNRLDKARKAFKKAQLDLEAAEEIKSKADMRKAGE